MPSSSSTTSRFRNPPLTSTRMAVAKPISLGAIKILKFSCRMFRYGARFLPFVLVSTDTSATLPQPTAEMKSIVMTPPRLASSCSAFGVMSMFMVNLRIRRTSEVGTRPTLPLFLKLSSDFSRTRRLWPADSGERTVSGGNRWTGPAAEVRANQGLTNPMLECGRRWSSVV